MATRYPNSICEAHSAVTTSEPVCIICMGHELTRARAENEALRAENVELVDDLEDWASQHKCGCEHPACNQCGRDEYTRRLLAKHQTKGVDDGRSS